MRALLVTWGSTGDVLPYVGLGSGLRAAGVEVTAVTSERLAPFFRRHGMTVRELPLARHEESALAADRFERGQSLRRLRSRKRNAQDMARVIARGVLDAASQGTDVLLAHPLAHPLCAAVAQASGTRCIGIYTAAPAMLLPRLSGATRMAESAWRLADALAWTAMNPLYKPALSSIADELGTGKGPGGARRYVRQSPVIHGFSPALLPENTPLPAGQRCAGYWWPRRAPDWQPEAGLTQFLHSGPAPVYIGFGSVAPGNPEHLGAMIKQAVRQLGVRAVVQAGWLGLNIQGDDIITIKECPHDWLFPRMSALVHHAGPGTAGAGLRSGVPAVTAPLALDQPFWSRRMHSLGLSPRGLDARNLTVPALTDSLRKVLTEPRYRTRTQAMSDRLRSEDGTRIVLDEIMRRQPA
ncbi:glycosyltransferase [Streptomyces cyaneofuscatus]|uniref:glycosyltransferase n=1 Tax=Streptomyces cyaneofuscatus TaxID=66883 RepID=UPI003867EB98|nr:glycosyltransferase [Streptomyces cyaneofuscatus]